MLKNQPLIFQKRNSLSLGDSFFMLKNEIKKNREVVDINKTKSVKKLTFVEDEHRKTILDENRFLHERLVSNAVSEDPDRRLEALRDLPMRMTSTEIAEAALDFDIIEKLTQMYRRLKQGAISLSQEEETLVLRTLKIFTMYGRGAVQLATKGFVIGEFYRMIISMDRNEELLAGILLGISNKTSSLQILVKTPNIYVFLEKILTRPYCTLYFPSDFWEHLARIIEYSPKDCMNYKFFDIFINRIKKKLSNYTEENMKCLALLLSCYEGQIYFFKIHGIKYLYELISPSTPLLENYEYVLLALRNATKNEIVVEDCRRYHDFPDILVNLAIHRPTVNEQLYCLEIVKSLTKIFTNQANVRTRCADGLRKIRSLSQTAEHLRLDLLRGTANPFYSPSIQSFANTPVPFPMNDPKYIPPY